MASVNKKHFKQLHQQAQPLVICNVWDAASAKGAEQQGFQAIGTSSAAISNILGYGDGEQMSFDELLFVVRHIAACCSLPLTVDIEAGYRDDPLQVASYIKTLAGIGVVGINIEDSKCQGQRQLLPAQQFADFLACITSQLRKDKVEVFINARTDCFILGLKDAVAETKKRAQLYATAGADGLFVPCMTRAEDIKAVVAETALPLNLMCMPELADFATLRQLGVKRISMGNFLFDNLQDSFVASLAQIKQRGSFRGVFSSAP